ncbi:histidine kinase N-terminal 7TM domain-containing protein [Halosolutus amylolyticus]|uniref:histidine kinase n=1 Tax=Halosolutus amylolyticus TaxID=2932267 RepID=A0ABD5PLM5_9EURY|nr:histidine kinase N-terminal 7TM domain-containing protein [Halosolutus amylolyticus]
MTEIRFLPLALVALSGGATAIAWYGYRRQELPGAGAFAALAGLMGVWTAAHAFRLASATFEGFWIWVNVEWIGIMFAPVAWLVFALRYAGQHQYVTRRSIAALCVVPLVVQVLVWTNPFHGLVRDGDPSAFAIGTGYPTWGVAFELPYYLAIGYSFLLVLAGAAVLLALLGTSQGLYRGRTTALLLGVFAPSLAGGWQLLYDGPIPGVDPTPVAFSVSMVCFGWALFERDLFEVVPVSPLVASRTVLAEMESGVIVVDTRRRIVEYNARATECTDRELSRGTRLEEVAEPLAAILDSDDDVDRSVVMGTASGTRHYDVEVSDIERGAHIVGRLLLLHDVTEQALREQQLDVLNRVLRHNVRHDTNLMLGHSSILRETLPSDQHEHVEQIEAAAENLATLSERSRLAERTMGEASANRQTIDLVSVVEQTVVDVRASRDGDPISTTLPDRAPVVAHESFELALEELLSNAFEHADRPAPDVTVTVERGQAETILRVSDDGPGIPDHEREVLETGQETALEHTSGLGLWLVTWLVRVSGGTLDIADRSPRGTIVEIALHAATTESIE